MAFQRAARAARHSRTGFADHSAISSGKTASRRASWTDSRWSLWSGQAAVRHAEPIASTRYVDRIEEIYRGMRGALIARESGCRVFHRTPPETTRPLQEARASRDRPRRCQSGMLKGSRLAGVHATAPNRHSLGLLRPD